MISDTKISTILVPDNASSAITFQCSQCGECCSSIMIHIELEKWKVLKDKPWFQDRLQVYDARVKEWNKNYALLPHKPDKTCVFLDEEKRCLIEANEGKDLKPSECRHFPFASLELDNGKRLYDCSAACKHVAESMLSDYRPIVPDTAWAKHLPAQKAPKQVRFSPSRAIDWETYQQRLLGLSNLFQSAGTVERALSAAGHYLADGNRPQLKQVSWPKWLQQAVLLFFLRKPYGTYSAIQLIQSNAYQDSYVFGTGNLPGVGLIRQDMVESAEAQELLKAFAYNILNRFVLFSHGHWASDILAIACIAAILARWHARVLAKVDGRQDVNRQDMANAIRLVERYYTGHQPRFLAFFNQSTLGIHWGYLLQQLLFKGFRQS